MVPEKVLPFRSSLFKSRKFPYIDEIPPSKLFVAIDKVKIFVKRFKDSGKPPKNELLLRDNFFRYLKLPILVGIDPDSLLEDSSRSLTNPRVQVTCCHEQTDISGT